MRTPSTLHRTKQWPPQTEWIPEFASRSPYNEEVIVRLITDWYRILVQFAYVNPANIEWAPPEGRSIDEAVCAELGLAPAVVRLLKLMPQHRNCWEIADFCPFSRSRTFIWSERGDIKESRNLGSDRNPQLVLPQDLALTHAMECGTSIIIDTVENTVYVTSPDDDLGHGVPLQVADDRDHYRNGIPRHAPSFFKWQIEQVQSLAIIPANCSGAPREILDFCGEYFHRNMHPRIKKALVEDYGWPDEFREEDWRRDSEEIWNSVLEDLDNAGLYM